VYKIKISELINSECAQAGEANPSRYKEEEKKKKKRFTLVKPGPNPLIV
jgi:hypothetical protein